MHIVSEINVINQFFFKYHFTMYLTDVIGVCKSASDVQELTAKSTGKLLKKREVTLVDQSGGAVSCTLLVDAIFVLVVSINVTKCTILCLQIILTLWGNEAETFDSSSNPVVSAKVCIQIHRALLKYVLH